MTRRWARVTRVLGAALGLVLTLVTMLCVVSVAREHRRYRVPDVAATISADSATIARGRHLVTAVAACTSCHGADLGGHIVLEQPLLGRFVAANLTRGAGGVGLADTDQDLLRAIRHGVGRDGRPLVLMPSDAYGGLSDEDLAAIVAYVRAAPPVDLELPPTRVGPLGRVLHLLGFRLLPAEHIDHLARASKPVPVVSVAWGRHLATVAGCRGCHGPTLGGDSGPGPDLTDGALAAWTEADFRRALREGLRPDGTILAEPMPWRNYAGLTDEELSALWSYVGAMANLD